ncbi:MAG: beta-N-acetylhexosaminidase [Deltaproteobacteria bacterium]|nr:beta-N-acetylhexosaminidase [Deltaproteobacteria bacterium]
MDKAPKSQDFSITLNFAAERPQNAAGRLLIVGWEGQDSGEIRDLIDEIRPGGLIFFRRNYPWPQDLGFFKRKAPKKGLSSRLVAPGRLREILFMVQKYALKVLGRPLIIAVDQEGGTVKRLPKPFFQAQTAQAMGQLEDLDVWRIGFRLGQELKESGFNLNLAPVLDLDTGEGRYIRSRAFGSDPKVVAQKAGAFMAGSLAAGVLNCGKHFPGLGGAFIDPHERISEIDFSLDKMATPMDVFRALFAKGLRVVMTSHVLYPALDPSYVATFSNEIVSVLRRDLGFDGLLLTDDLEMGGATGSRDPGRAAVRAVLAGHDLCLVCRRIEAIRAARQALVTAIANNQITKGHLLESGARLATILARLPALT